MHLSRFILAFCAAFLFGLVSGCDNPNTHSARRSASPQAPLPLNSNTVVRVHWMGKFSLSVDGSAYFLVKLWDMAESQRLQKATLDRLAQAPWRFYGYDSVAASQSVFLRPALDDILREETFFEVRQTPGQPADVALAVRIPERRAGEWFTNLAGAAQLLTGLAPQSSVQDPRSWSLRQSRSPGLIELTRVGDWTVLGAAETQNSLHQEVVARIRQDQRPAPPLADWLVADLDLPRLSQALGLQEPAQQDLPRVSLTMNGDGARVLTRAQLAFAQPLPTEWKPWTVPSQLIHEPLTSFTAVRGGEKWLPSISLWRKAQLGAAPDSWFLWAREGGSYQTFAAASLPDAVSRVQSASDRLMNQINPWLAKRGYVAFERWPDGNGVAWGDQAAFRPFLRSVLEGEKAFVFAGLIPEMDGPRTGPLRNELLQPLQTNTPLVYFNWENTGRRIEPWLFIGQNARIITRHAQLPMNSAGASWLGALMPRLDFSETTLTQTGPHELTFARKSTTGFTAPELHLLVDWLESPQFPRSFHSLQAAPSPSGQP